MARKSEDAQGRPVAWAPESFESLKELIAARYPSLSGQLQRIAHYVLDRPDEVALETITTLAERIGVQPSSMVRFSQALGYDGFTDMQKIFRSRLIAGASSYHSRIDSLRRTGAADGGNASGILSGFVDQGVASLQMLREFTSSELLDQAVQLLGEADEIYLVAQRRAFPVAFYLTYALGRLDQKCRLIDGYGGLFDQQMRHATPKDVAVAISFAPYSSGVQEAATTLRRRDVPVIALTDSALSPIALQARVAFEIKETSDRAFRSLVAPMCLAQSLVVALGLYAESQHDADTQ